jgi:3-methyl-2-oxobutanoate hydroxymethyltransferase
MGKPVRTTDLRKMKQEGQKIVMVTAYDYPTAKLVDDQVDVVLVGDSVGSNVLGFENELPVTLEIMIHHTKAVRRGLNQALLVADMPFLTYGISVEESLKAAGRLIKEAGAAAVKIEGAGQMCELVSRANSIGIPVMGHLGLTPQSIHKFGGFKVQANTQTAAQKLLNDAKELEQAGVFALVLEVVPREIAKEVSESLSIPTIGIGAGPDCDGQVLVFHDLVGLNPDLKPKHSKVYADLAGTITKAVEAYAAEVKSGKFPMDANSFHMPKP